MQSVNMLLYRFGKQTILDGCPLLGNFQVAVTVSPLEVMMQADHQLIDRGLGETDFF